VSGKQLLNDMLASGLPPKRGEFMIKPVKADDSDRAEPEVHAMEGVNN